MGQVARLVQKACQSPPLGTRRRAGRLGPIRATLPMDDKTHREEDHEHEEVEAQTEQRRLRHLRHLDRRHALPTATGIVLHHVPLTDHAEDVVLDVDHREHAEMVLGEVEIRLATMAAIMAMTHRAKTARNVMVRRLSRESRWIVLLIQKEGDPQSCAEGGGEELGLGAFVMASRMLPAHSPSRSGPRELTVNGILKASCGGCSGSRDSRPRKRSTCEVSLALLRQVVPRTTPRASEKSAPTHAEHVG